MQLRLRTYVEAKMTEALVRECPKCARKFVKTEGCNKMVRYSKFIGSTMLACIEVR